MGKHYRIDQSNDFRKIKLEIVTVILLIAVAIAGFVYVFIDLSSNETTINDENNRATLGVVESIREAYEPYETEFYSLKVPKDWRRVNNPELIFGGIRYYPDRYQGTTGSNVGRRVDIYVNDIPPGLGIDKVLSVSSNGNKIITGSLSDQCYTFTDFPGGISGNVFPSVWKEEDIDFSCRTSSISNVIGAIDKSQRTGVQLEGKEGTNNYLFVYTDHGSSQDNSIFYEILSHVRAK